MSDGDLAVIWTFIIIAVIVLVFRIFYLTKVTFFPTIMNLTDLGEYPTEERYIEWIGLSRSLESLEFEFEYKNLNFTATQMYDGVSRGFYGSAVGIDKNSITPQKIHINFPITKDTCKDACYDWVEERDLYLKLHNKRTNRIVDIPLRNMKNKKYVFTN